MSDIKSEVKRIISLESGYIFDQTGQPAWDNVVYHNRDEATIDAYINDGVTAILQRMPDVASAEGTTVTFTISGGKFQTNYFGEKDRFLTLYAVSRWFQQKYEPKAAEYVAMAAASLDKLVALVYQRSMPTR